MVTATPIERDRLDLLLTKMDALSHELRTIAEHQRRQDELIEELTPIAKLMMASGAARLGRLEEKGYFRAAEAVMAALDEVVGAVGPDEVKRLGHTAAQSLAKLSHPEEAPPMTVRKVLQASRDAELQRGLGVLVSVLRTLGGAEPTKVNGSAKARLTALLGPSKPRETRETPRLMAPAPALTVKPMAMPAKVQLDVKGVSLTADGFLSDPEAWSEGVAEQMAKALGYSGLSDEHWKVIRWARADYTTTHKSPNVRRLGNAVGGRVKDLYTLFPKTPGMSVARIAGIPKPVGCI